MMKTTRNYFLMALTHFGNLCCAAKQHAKYVGEESSVKLKTLRKAPPNTNIVQQIE